MGKEIQWLIKWFQFHYQYHVLIRLSILIGSSFILIIIIKQHIKYITFVQVNWIVCGQILVLGLLLKKGNVLYITCCCS